MAVNKDVEKQLKQIDIVRAQVHDIAPQILAFHGTKTTKEYVKLEEILTKQLLTLDSVDTLGGNHKIRTSRKMVVMETQELLRHLES